MLKVNWVVIHPFWLKLGQNKLQGLNIIFYRLRSHSRPSGTKKTHILPPKPSEIQENVENCINYPYRVPLKAINLCNFLNFADISEVLGGNIWDFSVPNGRKWESSL